MKSIKLPRSTPEEQGVPSSAIIAFLDRLKEEGQEHHNFMLLKNGYVIAEGRWYPYDQDQYHMLFSLSKSVTATAIGIAVKEGLLTVEDYIVDIFHDELPENYDKGYDKIKVKHVLSMSTGQRDCFVFSWDRKGSTWVQHFFNIPLEHEPGTKFMYNTGATYMLSAIITKLTGENLIDYLMPRLFEPLGIARPFSQVCPRGIAAGGWGLYLRIEDIAKFGQLYLNKGVFDGQRILTEEWVEEATGKQVESEGVAIDWKLGYGYQIWRGQHGTFRGDGAFCQYVIVMPEQNAVLACTNGMHDGPKYFKTIYEVLLPHLNSDKRLEENKENYKKLQEILNNLSYSPLRGAKSTTYDEKLFGKAFAAEDNKYGYKEILLDRLEDGLVKFTLKDRNGEYSVIGAHGKWHKHTTTLKQSIGFGLSIGADESKEYIPQPSFGSYAWEDEDCYKLCVRYSEAPTADEWTFKIIGDGKLEVLRNLSAAFEFNKREPVIFNIKN